MNEVLSQDEINALLRGLSDGDVDPGAAGEQGEGAPGGIRSYDLASQDRIIRGRMPTMELINDRFARALRNEFSKFFGRTCFVNVGSIEIVKFGSYIKELPLPSSLHIYRMPPLNGYGMLMFSTSFVFGMVETLFGGKGTGRVKIEGREFTPIENRLILKVTNLALQHLQEAWAPIHPVEFHYVRSEQNPLACPIVPTTDVVVISTIEVELEQESTTLQICTPYSTIEPIRQKLTNATSQAAHLEVDTSGQARMRTSLLDARVDLRVELARGTVKMRDLKEIQPGSILPLETGINEEAVVTVEGLPKLKGFVGTNRGSRAVRISKTLGGKKK